MHHRMERCYNAAMTPRAGKFGRIGGHRGARENARARLASSDAGCARRMRAPDLSNAATVLWPQYIALWENGGTAAGGTPLPIFRKTKQTIPRRIHMLRMLPLPYFAGESQKRTPPSKSQRFEWELCHSSAPSTRWEGGGWIPAKRVDVVGASVGHQMLAGDRLGPSPQPVLPSSRRAGEGVTWKGESSIAMNGAGERMITA
jgi:hypothetical protein